MTTYKKDRYCRICRQIIPAGHPAKTYQGSVCHLRCANNGMIETKQVEIKNLEKEIQDADDYIKQRDTVQFQDMGVKHNPRWQYDCDQCKFNWCCGKTCSCVLAKTKKAVPPKEVQDEVIDALKKARFCNKSNEKAYRKQLFGG